MKSAIQSLTKHPDIYLGNANSSSQQGIERLPLGIETLDSALAGGIPRAGLSRIRCGVGSGELQLLQAIFNPLIHQGKKILWIYGYYRINPVWLARQQLIEHSWLITPSPSQQALWACEQCIRSQACSLIVYSFDTLDVRSARRLQVLSKQYQCLVLNVDYTRHSLATLPVNIDCELYMQEERWFIDVHRVVGSWPKAGIRLSNPLPASNEAIQSAMLQTSTLHETSLTAS